MKVYILYGEGIECEQEAQRFFAAMGYETRMLSVPSILAGLMPSFAKGDLLYFPGGFSFADHFGSGKLLAFQLQSRNLFQKAFDSGMHLMGVCNGFQVLTSAGLFGKGVSLERNYNEKEGFFGFRNRWVNTRSAKVDAKQEYQLCARHGEGRLTRKSGAWDSHVEAYLRYDDPNFNNGSAEHVAALVARHGESVILGMMPHPEIVTREVDHPDAAPAEYMANYRKSLFDKKGDGIRFFQDFKEIYL